MASDVTIYLADGTSTLKLGKANRVNPSGSLYRFVKAVNWGDVTNTVFGHPRPGGIGFVRTGSAISEKRQVTMTVVSQYEGTNAERFLMDEANDDLPGLFAPGRGAWSLRVDRVESGGATTSRVLTVDTVSIPDTYSPDRMFLRDNVAWIETDWTLEAAFPLWRDRTATAETAITVANSAAGTTETKAWGAYTNSGMEACGLKCAITELTAGTITAITIVCTEAAKTLTWTDTGIALNDYVDFWVASPQGIAYTAGNSINAAGSIGLARGANNGTIVGTGSSSPAFKCQFSHVPFWRGC